MKKYLIICATVFLAILSTPLAGKIYESLIGRKINDSFLSIRRPEYFEGFFMSIVFFATLSIIIFVKQKKYKFLIIFLFVVALLELGQFESIIIDMGVAIIAFVLAQVVMLVNRKFKLLNL